MKKKNKLIGSIIIAIVFLVFTAAGFIKANKQENYDDIFAEAKTSETISKNTATSEVTGSSNKYVKVEIKGEILKPGVYSMNSGSRLEDLIEKAGGLTEKADKNKLPSLAKKLKDEECIIIPDKTNPTAAVPALNANSGSEGDLININTAEKEDLEKIPGVGPVTAQKIIDYREGHGTFNKIDDMKNISGIGEKTFEKMKDKITVD